MSSYNVIVTFNARTHSVRYWPDGSGRFYHGYATSLAQLKRAITKHFAANDLDLYIVAGTKNRVLTTDSQIRNHIDRLPKGTTTLHLSAVQRKRPESSPKQLRQSKPSKQTRTTTTLVRTPVRTPAPVLSSRASKSSKSSPKYAPTLSPKTRITWVPVVISN